MRKIILLSVAIAFSLINCTNNDAAKKAEAEQAAAAQKEAAQLDSLTNELEKTKAEIETDAQKVEDALKEIGE